MFFTELVYITGTKKRQNNLLKKGLVIIGGIWVLNKLLK